MAWNKGRVVFQPPQKAADGGEAAGEGAVGLTDRRGLDGLERPFLKGGLDGLDGGVGAANLVVRMHDECKRLDSDEPAQVRVVEVGDDAEFGDFTLQAADLGTGDDAICHSSAQACGHIGLFLYDLAGFTG